MKTNKKGNTKMSNTKKTEGTERTDAAVSPVIGFVLMIALSAIALTVLQLTAVPVWNEGVEFDHSRSVQDDMQNLRSEGIQVSATGRASTSNLGLGTAYPRRFLFLNPPSPSGTVSTGGETVFVVENAVATNNETADYWDGTAAEFPTRSVVYEPRYNVLSDDRRIVYEGTGSVDYDEQGDGQATVSDTVLVSGRRITLVSVDGSLSKSGSDTESLDFVPLSAPYTSVGVAGNDTENIRVTVPTGLSEERWNELLAEQTVGNGGYVAGISVDEDDDTLTVELVSERDGETVEYDLRTAKVGVGSGLTEEDEHYMTTEAGNELTAPGGSSISLVVQVRDRYNNPVSGVVVEFDADDGVLSADNATTRSDGEARVTYQPSTSGVSTVRASMAGRAGSPGFDPSTKEDVEFSVTAVGSGTSGGGEGSDINPNPSGLVFEDADMETCSTGPGGGGGGGNTVTCASTMGFTNTNVGDLNVAEARINFYSPDQGQGLGTFRQPPTRGVLEGTSLDIGGLFMPVNIDFSPGSSQKTVEFYKGSDEFEIEDGDFYVITFLFEDGERPTYFVLPQP